MEQEQTLTELVKYIKIVKKEIKEIRRQLTAEAKPLYSNKEMMDVFGVSTDTLKIWRDEGKLGYSKIGNTYLYSKKDVADFLELTHYDAFRSDKRYKESLH